MERVRAEPLPEWGPDADFCFCRLDYSSLYMCKPKRSLKRDDTKDTYKLPHRLIEKKRRDRINECIAQLKDLLPEHLKLTVRCTFSFS